MWQGRRKWDLFGERSEAIHRAQRRLVSQIYSLSNMKKLEPYVDNATTLFLQKLKDMSGKEMNMTKWAQLYAFGEFYLEQFSNFDFNLMKGM